MRTLYAILGAMDNPTVACVMLVNGRQAMVARAVASFRAQTYREKTLLVWDTGDPYLPRLDQGDDDGLIVHIHARRQPGRKIGALRNDAMDPFVMMPADIIAHFDSDDISHPRRLEEQVALLQASGKDCVGYSDMLFWDTRPCSKPGCKDPNPHGGDDTGAWIYAIGYPGNMLGASLCYWRRAWERSPFNPRWPTHPLASGEDWGWYQNQERVAVSSLWQCPDCDGGRHNVLPCCPSCGLRYDPSRSVPVIESRMICSIHAGNTSGAYAEDVGKRSEWRRAPAWDEYCSRTMQLPVAIAT